MDNFCLSCRRAAARHILVCPHCRGTMVVAAQQGGVPGAREEIGEGYGQAPVDPYSDFARHPHAPRASTTPQAQHHPRYSAPPSSRTAGAVIALILFWPTGIPALINARRVHDLWRLGDHHGAEAARSRAFGWSLVSWIVGGVAASIGLLLASIAAVSYNQYVDDARDKAVTAMAKQVSMAFTAYSAENDLPASEAWLGSVVRLQTSGLELSTGISPVDGQILVRDPKSGRHVCVTLGPGSGDAAIVGPVRFGTPAC